MSPRTFISYSRQDSDFAKRLVADLTKHGVSVWLDQRDIKTGQRWDTAIQQALQECSQLLVVLTSYSVTSQNVLDEIAYAITGDKRVFPILLQSCDIPYRLARVQYIDFRTDYGVGLQRLITELSYAGEPTSNTSTNSDSSIRIQQTKGVVLDKTCIVTVRREKQFLGPGDIYGIYLDDNSVGRLKAGRTIKINAAPGSHSIYVKWSVFKSKRFIFNLGNGENISLICGEHKSLLWSSYFIEPDN